VRGFLIKKARFSGKIEGPKQLLESSDEGSQPAGTHNVPLSPDVAKVTVERVRVPDARVGIPSDEVTTVANGFQTFVAWPRHDI